MHISHFFVKNLAPLNRPEVFQIHIFSYISPGPGVVAPRPGDMFYIRKCYGHPLIDNSIPICGYMSRVLPFHNTRASPGTLRPLWPTHLQLLFSCRSSSHILTSSLARIPSQNMTVKNKGTINHATNTTKQIMNIKTTQATAKTTKSIRSTNYTEKMRT